MGQWVALLRGINVGTAKRIAMADLRRVFEDAGFTGVKTLLNSGNVVFSSAAVGAAGRGRSSATARAAGDDSRSADAEPSVDPAELQAAVLAATGVDSEIIVVEAAAFAAIAAANPLRRDGREPKRLSVAFPAARLDVNAVAALAPVADALAPEEIAVTPEAIYQWLPDGVLASRVPPSFWKSLPVTVTARNDATVHKLVALLA